MIKRLILLKIQNMMDIKKVLLQWFINSLIKKTSGSGTKNENIRPAITRRITQTNYYKIQEKKSRINF